MSSNSFIDPDGTRKIINHTGATKYLLLLIVFWCATAFRLHTMYIGGEGPLFLIAGIPSAWFLLACETYCIWYQIRYGDMIHSLKVFLVFAVLFSFTSIIFSKAGVHNILLIIFPVVVMLLSWVFSRKISYLVTGAICLLIVYLVYNTDMNGVMITYSGVSSYVLAVLCSIGASAIFASIISEANEKHFARQEELISTLEEKVRARTKELEASIVTLTENHEKLEHAARMESLAYLVVGIAHKLNTPIGNIVLASSMLEDKVTRMLKLVSSKGLSRTEFSDFVSTASSVAALLKSSSGTAAELIETFKKLSFSATDEKKKMFSLRSCLEGVIFLARQKHGDRWTISLNDFLDIECYSYSEYLESALSAVLENSAVHGGENGEIVLSIALCDEMVQITISDNGVGIPKENLGKVFEPFFTTNLGAGNAGLGLSIVYQTMDVLGGGIYFKEQDSGASAVLTFPRNLPG